MQGVSDTLFIPLEARIFVSEKFPEYFYDEKALWLKKYIPNDSIRRKSSEYSFMASVARYYNMDFMAKEFILKHHQCNIVYLGAGLETAYYRLNANNVMFYEVDLPEVIATRRSILGETSNDILIGEDMFNLEWTDQIEKTKPTLIFVSGVFQYFKEEKVVDFINNLKGIFNKSELVFDATNEVGIKYANKYVQKTGNTNAFMYFYVNDSAELAKKTATTLLDERVFFSDARRILSKKLGLYTRIAMKVVDDKKRAILLHLRID